MSGVTLKGVTPATITSPASGKVTIFSNSSDSNIPYYKNSSGTSTSLKGAAGDGYDTVQAHGNTGATETFDYATADFHTATLDANCTFTFTGATNGVLAILGLRLTQDGTGSRTVTWPASVTWAEAGTAPTLQTAAASVDELWFDSTDGGTTWYGHYGRLPLTTRGDLLTRSATANVRLAIGAANRVLTSDGTDPSWAQVTEAMQVLADNTTNNASTSAHGYLKKLSNVSTEFMNGQGNWATPAGGGGLTFSTVGYTTAGASFEAERGLFLKAVTPATGKLLVNINAYVRGDGTNVGMCIPVIYDDNAGAPGKIIAMPWPSITSTPTRVMQSILNTTARWVTMPINWKTNGSQIWIGVWLSPTDSVFDLAYDGSGSDYRDISDAQNQPVDASITAPSSTTNNYSIYADVIA